MKKKWVILGCALMVLAAAAYGAWRLWPGKQPVALALRETKAQIVAMSEEPTGQGEALLLINKDNPLDPKYFPRLVNLYSIKGRGFSLSSDDIELTSETFEAAKEMFAAAKADGVEDFILTSGYRTLQQQQAVYDAQPTLAAKPGASEHASGMAFDVTAYGNDDFTRTAQYKWLYEHCWDYGFILRYPSDKAQITGCPAEAWHYRYVGLPHSRLMGEMGMCLEEYVAYVQAQGVMEVTLDGQVYRVEGAPGQPVRSYKVS